MMTTQCFLADINYILRHAFKYEYIFSLLNNPLKFLKLHQGKTYKQKIFKKS